MHLDGEGLLSDSQKARLNTPPCQEPYDSGMNMRIGFLSQQGFSDEFVYRQTMKKFSADGRKKRID